MGRGIGQNMTNLTPHSGDSMETPVPLYSLTGPGKVANTTTTRGLVRVMSPASTGRPLKGYPPGKGRDNDAAQIAHPKPSFCTITTTGGNSGLPDW